MSGTRSRYRRRVRWERLFDDLEGELAGARAAERSAEVAERSRVELGQVLLLDRFAACGGPVQLDVLGAGPLLGRVGGVGDGWLLVQGTATALVPVGAVVSAQGLGRQSRAATMFDVSRRLSLASALRRVARDRSPVRLTLRDGRRLTGTVDAVAGDHLDLAEHAADEPRRAAAVTRVRSVPFAALAVLEPAGPTTLA